MSADTVVNAAETTAPREQRSPRKSFEQLVAELMQRDFLGVRVGVLLLILPVFICSIAMQITSRQLWNHPPDSRYYLPMMARDMGHSWPDSIQMNQNISPGWHLSGWYFANNDPTWQMVRTRLLYPVLSIPFVWMWGLSGGSLVVPVLGDILFFWVIARVLQRLYGPGVAAIVVILFTLTQPIFGFSWAGTDTLAMGLAAVIVANLPIERRIGKANLVWLGAASIFIALTRQVGVLAPAMAGAGWLWLLIRERNWRNRWLGALIVTAATTLVIEVVSMMVTTASAASVISHGETTYPGIAREFVHYLKLVTQEAMTYMWHNDRVLLGILVTAGVGMVVRFKSDAAAVFFGAAAATYVITAGIGFSQYMRYEMVMFPAAAVAAGAMVQLLLGEHLPFKARALAGAAESAEAATVVAAAADSGSGDDSESDSGSASASAPVSVPSVPKQRFSPAAALGRTAPGRYLGFDQPRPDRWKPQLVLSVAVLAVVLGVSLPGSWGSTPTAPPSPSVAAAQGGSYASTPLAKPGAEVTLKAAFDQASGLTKDSDLLQYAFDWVHTLRYRPTAADQPGWSTRDKDGTTVIHINSLELDRPGQEAFGRALSLNRTVRSDTVKILSRQVSEWGEDVTFTVLDETGAVHQGTATTLYPIWDKKDPGVVTSLVFDN
ncbi:hypothetical protein [Catenulispora pinisilvae]|uniref:hypothetical protein n=1 Tax=Catenulispora pinisilvae TaxID=2705253 RepID=UPI0018920F04|nr:hypothetical protein [Catenulispora pinisilvae]